MPRVWTLKKMDKRTKRTPIMVAQVRKRSGVKSVSRKKVAKAKRKRRGRRRIATYPSRSSRRSRKSLLTHPKQTNAEAAKPKVRQLHQKKTALSRPCQQSTSFANSMA